MLGRLGEQGESSIGGDPVTFHQDALGVPDEVPVDDRPAHLPGPQRISESERGQVVANIVVMRSSRSLKGDGLPRVQAERAQDCCCTDTGTHSWLRTPCSRASAMKPGQRGSSGCCRIRITDLPPRGLDVGPFSRLLLLEVEVQGRAAGRGPRDQVPAL